MSSPRPSISVIVPIRNEEPYIGSTLDQLLTQDRDGLDIEILVIDGQSTDRTRDIVKTFADRHPEIQLLDNPKRLSSAARNIGIKQSHGEYILLIDGHCEIPTRSYFRNLVQAFEESGADCLGRPQPLDVTNATSLQKAIAAARSSRLGHHPASFIYSSEPQYVPAKSVAVAYRRSVFDQVGYFDETFDACEDYEFNHRVDLAVLRCWFTPDLEIMYHPRNSLRGLFLQLVRYGCGRIRLMRKWPATKSISTLIPAAFLLGLIIGLPLSFVSKWLAVAYVGSLLVYLCLLLLVAVQVFFQSGIFSLSAWLPVVLATIHIGSGIGLLMELVNPQAVVLEKKVVVRSANKTYCCRANHDDQARQS